MSTPTSTIKVCSGVRLTNDYLHTIWFNNTSEQLNYFAGKVVKTFSAYTYIRKSWSIKVDATMEQARKWSYLYFQNGTGKTYYYFINNIEYINDNTVELFIEMDVMQTYLFDFTLHECFVEREHANSDAPGDNIVEETLELGDLRVIDEMQTPLSDLCVLVLATYDPINTSEENTDTVLAAKYNGVFSGLGVYAVNLSDWQAWGAKLRLLDDYGKSEGIVAMWMYPKDLVQLAGDAEWTDGNVTKEVSGVTGMFSASARLPYTSGNYTPRNKKLLTYPYNFIYVTNNSGNAGVFRYERFGDPSYCNFKIVGALSPEGSVKLYPLNYNGVQHNYEEGLTLGGFPTCAWNQDVYKLWLAQNQNSQNLSMVMSGLTIAGGVGTMIFSGGAGAVAGAGAVLHGASSIASILAQRADKELQPAQAKGQHSASVNVVAGFQTFNIQRKSIGVEYARILDDYFDMFGYQTNRVKVPERNCREHWTYTKTVGCHVSGNLCTEDLRKIESIFDNGVTHWYGTGDNIGNYSLSNACTG